MNRTQAIERVDEILGLFAEMYVSGRCPRCEVPLYDADDKQHPLESTATRRVVHEGSCEVGTCSEELTGLTKRFGIALEPVLLTVPASDTWIMTARRARAKRRSWHRDRSHRYKPGEQPGRSLASRLGSTRASVFVLATRPTMRSPPAQRRVGRPRARSGPHAATWRTFAAAIGSISGSPQATTTPAITIEYSTLAIKETPARTGHPGDAGPRTTRLRICSAQAGSFSSNSSKNSMARIASPGPARYRATPRAVDGL
jgi:hypothetical protein